MVSCSPIPHTLAGIAEPLFGKQSDWKPPSNEVQATPRTASLTRFLLKSHRCAIDNVIVTIHCNARWNDNIFFCQAKSKFWQPQEKIYLQIIKTAGEVLELASFVAEAVGCT